MSASLLWLNENWFPFLQSVGIVASLLLTAAAFRRDTRSRKASDLLNLLEQHRQLWGELHRRPELKRILSGEVNLLAEPISLAEEEYVNLIIVHYHTGWMLAHAGTGNNLKALAADIKSFFKLPIANRVWRETKSRRDPEFTQFVDSSLAE